MSLLLSTTQPHMLFFVKTHTTIKENQVGDSSNKAQNSFQSLDYLLCHWQSMAKPLTANESPQCLRVVIASYTTYYDKINDPPQG